MHESGDTQRLLDRVRAGDGEALDQLLARHRPYLRQVVGLRLDPRLRQRVDPSDIVQETQVEASRRIAAYLACPPMSFRLWLRQLAYDRLVMMWRRHVQAGRRDMTRELPLPDQSTCHLARQLLADGSSPSEHLARDELCRRVRQALMRLSEADREVLLMRNFEGLTNQEVAEVLGIEGSAANKRYGRALLRLRVLLLEGGPAGSVS